MKYIVLLILLSSFIYAAPGDKIKEVMKLYYEYYGFAVDIMQGRAFFCYIEYEYSQVDRYNLYTWSYTGAYQATGDPSNISASPLKHLNALLNLYYKKVDIRNYSGSLQKSISLSYYPSATCYACINGHNYLYVVEKSSKRLQTFDADNDYTFIEERHLGISDTELKSGCYGLCYDGAISMLLCVTRSSNESSVYALDPNSLVKKASFTWSNKSIQGIEAMNDYQGLGRCYLVSHCDPVHGTIAYIDAVEAFTETGFSSNSYSIVPIRNVSTYPNPFSNKIHIDLPESGSIYSINGQLIKYLNKGRHDIDTSSWKAGIYTVYCNNKELRRIVKID